MTRRFGRRVAEGGGGAIDRLARHPEARLSAWFERGVALRVLVHESGDFGARGREDERRDGGAFGGVPITGCDGAAKGPGETRTELRDVLSGNVTDEGQSDPAGEIRVRRRREVRATALLGDRFGEGSKPRSKG